MEEYFTKENLDSIIATLRQHAGKNITIPDAFDCIKIVLILGTAVFFFYLLRKFETLINRDLVDTLVYKVKDENKLLNEIHICSTLPNDRLNLNRCVSLIMEAPNVINIPREPYGFTPFLNACWSGCTPLVRFMLTNGADINRKTKDGDSAMYLAVRALLDLEDKPADLKLLNVLLSAGCSVDDANYNGFTPLHLAAMTGDVHIAKWLLEHGADAKMKTAIGETALQLAQSEGHKDIVQILPTASGGRKRK